MKAYQAGNYSTAETQLGEAYELLRAPSLGLWSARALSRVGKLVEASQRYLEVSQLPVSAGDPAVQTRARAEAAKELSELKAKIPTVTFRLEGASRSEVAVSVDGTTLSSAELGERRPINPGKHRVEARRAEQRIEKNFDIAEGATQEVVLSFDAASDSLAPVPSSAMPSSAPAPSASSTAATRTDSTRTLAFVALGVAGAGLVFGSITGVLAIGKKSTLDDSDACRDNTCLESEQDSVDGYHSLRTLSTIGFVSGVAFGAAGGVLLLVDSKKHGERSPTGGRTGATWVGLRLSPQGASLRGVF